MNPHVLLVSNESSKSASLAQGLHKIGFHVSRVECPEIALESVRHERPDAVVLGVDCPLVGQEIVERLRAQGDVPAPVLVLLPRGEEGRAIATIEAGADDFLLRPVRVEELAARLQIVMSRHAFATPARDAGTASTSEAVLRAGDIFVIPERHEAYRRLADGSRQALCLTKREFALLVVLMRHKNRMISREAIVREAFGENAPVNPRNLGAYVHRLREKIEPVRSSPSQILTDRGLGFKIVD